MRSHIGAVTNARALALAVAWGCTGCVGPGLVENGPLYWNSYLRSEGNPVTAVEAGIRLTTTEADGMTLRVSRSCAAVLRAFTVPVTTTSRSWDQRVWDAACQGTTETIVLRRSMEYLALSGTIDVADILGDSLPSGRYEISATLFSPDLLMGRVDITVGQVDLQRP